MPHPTLVRQRKYAIQESVYMSPYSGFDLYANDNAFQKLVDTLVAMLRGRSKGIDLFSSACCFGKSTASHVERRTPAFVDGDKVYTFPYVTVSKEYTNSLSNITPWAVLHYITEEPWVKKIIQLKKDKEQEKLDKYYERLTKKIRKIKPMSLSAYVKKHDPSLDLKKLRTSIDALSGGVEFKIASSPEEVSFVYTNGPHSCMKKADKSRLKDKMLEQGVHPASWYSHCPETGVAYLKHGDTVVARTVIYPPIKVWVRVYSEYIKFSDMLIQELKNAGYTGLQQPRGPGTFSGKFKVPGVKVDETWVCPAPVLDYVANRHIVSFDEDTKEFNWKPTDSRIGEEQDDGIVFALDFTRGYISANQTRTVNCAICSIKCSAAPNHRRITNTYFAKDGSAFCGDKCKEAAGYVYAREADGNEVLIPSAQVEAYDLFGRGGFYTTEYAKEKAGGLPLLLHPSNRLDECKLFASPANVCRIAFIAREATSDRCAIPVGISDAVRNNIAGLDAWKLAEIRVSGGNKRYLFKQSVDGEPQVYEPGKKLTNLLKQAHKNAEKWLGVPCTLKSCVGDTVLNPSANIAAQADEGLMIIDDGVEPLHAFN